MGVSIPGKTVFILKQGPGSMPNTRSLGLPGPATLVNTDELYKKCSYLVPKTSNKVCPPHWSGHQIVCPQHSITYIENSSQQDGYKKEGLNKWQLVENNIFTCISFWDIFIQISLKFIEDRTKWLPFCRQYFHMHFGESKVVYLYSNYVGVCSQIFNSH